MSITIFIRHMRILRNGSYDNVAGDNLPRLLIITFLNGSDPYQDRQNVGPDVSDTLMLFLKDVFEKKS